MFCLLYKHQQNTKPLHFFAVKGEICKVTIAAVTILCVKILAVVTLQTFT